MRHFRLRSSAVRLALSVGAFAVLLLVGAGEASAATLTVCASGCAFTQIAPAIAAASPGDTIKVGAGTYEGGLTIDKSLTLAGAGSGSTNINGGGPVITIGTFNAASEPTVSISGVTITGGVTHSSFVEAFVGPNVIAVGGGISVPPGLNFSPGATVSIKNSVITDNRVEPLAAIDSGLACPPDVTITCINGDLPFAQAAGGGINTFGATTLINTTVSDNRVGGPVASDADGGGVESLEGGLTLKNSTVTGNQAIASAPNGRFADTGGVFVGSGLTMDGSLVSGNSATISTAMPNDIQDGTAANSGGVHIAGDDNCATSDACAIGKIRNSTITGNTVTASNSIGDAVDFCGGVCDDGRLTLADSLVSNNHVSATVPADSTACACADSAGVGSGGIESFTDSHISGNSVTASAPSGSAFAAAGGGSGGNGLSITISDSVFSGNTLTANTTTGTAHVQGGGFSNFGAVLTIRGTTFGGNSGTANGPGSSALGGGIWNGNGGTVTLLDSSITHNTLTASTAQGGGLFTANPATIKDTVIANNVPDQCFGC